MALLNTLLSSSMLISAVSNEVAKPAGMWEWFLLNVFGFIQNYGLRIIVFIVLLKIALLPLDLFQRYKMRKNTKITEMLKPQMDKLKEQYAQDPKILSAKQMELNRKSGYSYFSACIPLVLTLVIFFTLFSGMRSISQYMIFRQYASWYDTYNAAIIDYKNTPAGADFEARRTQKEADIQVLRDEITAIEALEDDDETIQESLKSKRTQLQTLSSELAKILSEAEVYAQGEVVKYNEQNADSFLWIKSLWQPDVMWANPIETDRAAFEASIGAYGKLDADKGKVGSDVLADMLSKYDSVTKQLVASDNNKQNGLLILVILSFLLSVGSQFITQRLQKKSGQFEASGASMGGSMKFMMFIMPVIIVVFAVQYTAAFALYMVANSAMTILINVSTTLLMNAYDANKKKKAETTVLAYGRRDPNQQTKDKKNISNKNNYLNKK